MMTKYTELTVNIPQAAKMLKVTTKTIYNYLEKGIVDAQKWNGSWRISHQNIIELYKKKYGTSLERIEGEVDSKFIEVRPNEFARLNESVGRLEAIKSENENFRNEAMKLHERIGELEASAASGWTEARKCREDLNNSNQTRGILQEEHRESLMECEILKRELTSTNEAMCSQDMRIEELIRESESLKGKLTIKEMEFKDCHSDLVNLKDRYRRDAFL
jgi:chromosome segregation ATPase